MIKVFVFSLGMAPVTAKKEKELKKIAGNEEISVVVLGIPIDRIEFKKWMKANLTKGRSILVLEDGDGFPDEYVQEIKDMDYGKGELLYVLTPKLGFCGYVNFWNDRLVEAKNG